MSAWHVRLTYQAERDLDALYAYIAESLLEPETAARQLARIVEGMEKLSYLPLRHRVYSHEPWRTRGLRMLPVDNYLVCYLPNEDAQMVQILRVMYNAMDVERQLSQTEI